MTRQVLSDTKKRLAYFAFCSLTGRQFGVGDLAQSCEATVPFLQGLLQGQPLNWGHFWSLLIALHGIYVDFERPVNCLTNIPISRLILICPIQSCW